MGFHTLEALLGENKNVLYTQAVLKAQQSGAAFYTHTVDCDEEALFDLASVSKLFTATMLLRLIGQNRLSLDATLKEALKNEPLGKVTKERLSSVSLKSALYHASGLPAWYPFYTGKDFFETLEALLQSAPVESGTLYSDINFILLGLVVKAVSGKDLPENLSEINSLLGTGFTYNPQNRAACVPTEFGNQCEMRMCQERGLNFMPLPPQRMGWRDTSVQIQGEVNDGNCYYAFKGVSGHAGVFGKASDLVKLGALYLNFGTYNGVSYIPEALARAALRDSGGGRGLGFDLGDVFPHGAGHTGFTGTALWICHEKQLSAALLTSRLPLGLLNLQPLRKQVFELLYDAAV